MMAEKRPPHRPADRQAEAPPPILRRLDDLEAALRNALRLGGGLPRRAVRDLARQVAQLRQAAANVPPALAQPCVERLRRIRELHDQLALRLTAQRDDAAAALAQIRKGKQTLKAYGQNA
jgi:hypothetical protein